MLLIFKLNFNDFQNYRQEYSKCLLNNCENAKIKKVIAFTDLDIKDLPKHNKISYITKRGISSKDAVEYAKKISKEEIIIFSSPFFIFTNELDKIEFNRNVLTKNYSLFFRSYNHSLLELDPSHSLEVIKPKKEVVESTKEDTNQVIRKKGDIVKTTNHFVRLNRIDVIIVSVNYNDYLLVSLSHNIKIFENITVVTSSDDLMCQKICEKFGVNVIITDRMYENEAVFNKGKAINEGIKSISNPEWILLLDADIIVNNKFDFEKLSTETLYTSGRWICTEYIKYESYKQGSIGIESIAQFEENRGLGFFQLFSFLKEKSYPESSDDAAWSDLMFRDKFPKRENVENQVIHLGDAYRNWEGRITKRFISDDEFQKLLPKPFDINKYFDKIYCINLDRRVDRWMKCVEQFNYFKIEVDRFSAVDGENLNINKSNENLSNIGLIENDNSLACLNSHLNVIKDAKANGYKRILIFEDDILISNEFNNKIRECEKIEWSLLYLGSSQFDWEGIECKKFYECKNTLGTFAYAVECNLFDEIIEVLSITKKSVDNSIVEIQLRHKGHCFTYFPNIVISDVNNSDIRESKDMSSYSKMMKWNTLDFIRTNEKKSIINKKEALLNLIELDELFNKLNVEYWITCGTLLGFYRENDFIGHDKDTDICVNADHFNGYVLKRITSIGFQIINYFGTIDDGFEISFKKNGVKLDIFLFYKKERWFNSVYSDFQENDYLKHNYIYEPFEISEKIFMGYSFKVPNDTEKWIINHYGSDYRVPKKDWIWWKSPLCLENTDKRVTKEESNNSMDTILNYDKNILLNNLTILIKSFMREECVYNLISSIRKFYPKISILIVDDSKEITKFDIDDNIKTYNLEFDSGLSKGRNFGVSKINTEFFLLLDDDFEFTNQTDLIKWMDLMIESGLDILGGDVIMDNKKMDYFADLELIDKKLYYRREKNKIEKDCKICDMVLNFFIAKTEVIKKYKWDDSLKLAEHTAFFFEHKGKIKVGHSDEVSILHQKINEGEYSEYRNRGRIFFNEWMKRKGIEESINLQNIVTKTK